MKKIHRNRQIFASIIFFLLASFPTIALSNETDYSCIQKFNELHGFTEVGLALCPYKTISEMKAALEDIDKAFICPTATELNNLRHSLCNEDIRIEPDIIRQYTEPDFYQELNSALWSGSELGTSLTDFKDKLTFSLKCLPCYVGLVYRLAYLPENTIKDIKVHDTLLLRGFTSTTKCISGVEEGFFTHNVKMYIWSNTGKYIACFSCFPMEEEVLFLSGTSFRVLDLDVNPETDCFEIALEEVVGLKRTHSKRTNIHVIETLDKQH